MCRSRRRHSPADIAAAPEITEITEITEVTKAAEVTEVGDNEAEVAAHEDAASR
ncbi:hypothetical protein [Candidatus Protofrankia californiensis]|uniref:hypothetical protein n=1 Tax=Candidatus Protofrankia californiensis TaxID=1839754 RepID=UPI0013EA87E8|nr:hypothetical protein [Candidatus Protofrankia californiensis]